MSKSSIKTNSNYDVYAHSYKTIFDNEAYKFPDYSPSPKEFGQNYNKRSKKHR